MADGRLLQWVRMVTEDSLLIYSLHELANHQRHALYPLNLLLCAYQLTLEAPAVQFARLARCCFVKSKSERKMKTSKTKDHDIDRVIQHLPLLILDVFLLQVYVFKLALQLLEG